MNAAVGAGSQNTVGILVNRAAAQPNHIAYHFIGDDPASEIALSYAELLQEAASLATLLQQHRLAGQPVLLTTKSNRLFVIGFHACLMAGALAIPTAPPRRAGLEQRLDFIGRHAGIAAILSDSDIALGHDFSHTLARIDLRADPGDPWPHPVAWEPPSILATTPAYIQYTSGTSHEPHGVVFNHGNILLASQAIGKAFRHSENAKLLISLPLFHDPGLMMGVLHPMVCGVPVYLMTPAQFVQRPLRWLRLLQQHRITTAGGQNFMFDIVIKSVRPDQLGKLDLSEVQAMFCTGEPIRSATIARFMHLLAPRGLRQESLIPCYSLTEAGRPVSGGVTGSPPKLDAPGMAGIMHPLISCGAAQPGCRILIVDPVSRCEQAEGMPGEIWLQADSLAQEYWKEALLTEAVFGARLANGDGPFLRTGDAAYLKAGELYFLGRLDERIRIHGCNHAPHDIEMQVERSHPGIRPSSAAAFAVDGHQRVRLVILCEIKKEMLRRREKWPQIESAIRSAIRRVHNLPVDDIVILMPGTLPKTASGKIRRNQCRTDYLDNKLSRASDMASEIASKGLQQPTEEN
jgi:acyl-CoA synthetase (AMP-forming)/AMP-acid ligase II